MIISSPFNFFDEKKQFLKHYRLSLMSRAYRFIWKPRFGWQRKLITNPLMRIFHYWRKIEWLKNKFYLRFSHQSGNVDIVISSKDMQLAPSPKNYEFGPEPDLQFLLRALSFDIHGFYDIGANYGFFSLFLASLESFKGVCYAFEPTPTTFNTLEALVSAVDLNRRINAINIALSDRSGDFVMTLPVKSHSGYAKVANINDRDTYKVSAIKLDEWIMTGDKKSPSFIKIDVEGHEFEVLEGARRTITGSRPYVYFENGNTLMPSEHQLIYDFFKNHDYVLFIPTWMYVENDLWRTCRIPLAGKKNHLTLISIEGYPEVLWDRSMLMVLNIFACPREKVDQLKKRLHVMLG